MGLLNAGYFNMRVKINEFKAIYVEKINEHYS